MFRGWKKTILFKKCMTNIVDKRTSVVYTTMYQNVMIASIKFNEQSVIIFRDRLVCGKAPTRQLT